MRPIGDVSTEYVLTVGGYSGTAGDSFGYHSGMKFSTKDNDNDVRNDNCATRYTGAWWYNGCYYSNLNGQYLDGVHWNHWTGRPSLKFTEMKLREKY